MGKGISISSIWNINFCGNLDDVLFLDDFKDISKYSNTKKLLIFKEEFDLFSHNSLMFLENYRPYVCLKETLKIDSEVRIKISTVDGKGILSLANESEKAMFVCEYPNPPEYAICDTVNGLNFLSKNGCISVMIRGEVLFSMTEPRKESFLKYACQAFKIVHVRLVDNNDIFEKNLGNARGYDFLESNSTFLGEQLAYLNRFQIKFNNLKVVVPFLKNENELAKLKNLISPYFVESLICMIETPLMLARFKYYCNSAHHFIIGIKDMFDLLGGFNGTKLVYIDQLEKFLKELISYYCLPYCTKEHTIYITSKSLYNHLVKQKAACQLIYLAKY